jgi:hypothetical protein
MLRKSSLVVAAPLIEELDWVKRAKISRNQWGEDMMQLVLADNQKQITL